MTNGTYRHLPALSGHENKLQSLGDEAPEGILPNDEPLLSRARIIITTQQAVQFPATCNIQQIKASLPPLYPIHLLVHGTTMLHAQPCKSPIASTRLLTVQQQASETNDRAIQVAHTG